MTRQCMVCGLHQQAIDKLLECRYYPTHHANCVWAESVGPFISKVLAKAQAGKLTTADMERVPAKFRVAVTLALCRQKAKWL